MNRKGILLAGGAGTRLFPATAILSKQLLPVYDKPMVYYALSTLMLAGIKDILLICTKRDLPLFEKLFENFDLLGVRISFAVQKEANGIAEALIIAEDFLNGAPCALILGDNIFYGNNFKPLLDKAHSRNVGASLFSFRVDDPTGYGVVKYDKNGDVIDLLEKPSSPPSNHAITGLYFYDQNAPKFASTLKPSSRGELEITDLNLCYLRHQNLNIEMLGRGFNWFDAGTSDNLFEAGQLIHNIEKRQGLKISCPEEIAVREEFITRAELKEFLSYMTNSPYREYLYKIVDERVDR